MIDDIEGMYSPVGFSRNPEPDPEAERLGQYCLYEPNGRIVSIRGGGLRADCQRDAAERGLDYLFVPVPQGEWARWYVVDGEYTERPILPFQLEGYKLSGIPAGAVMTIEQKEYTADGTPIELEFSHSGTYIVHVDPFPYRELDITVNYETPA